MSSDLLWTILVNKGERRKDHTEAAEALRELGSEGSLGLGGDDRGRALPSQVKNTFPQRTGRHQTIPPLNQRVCRLTKSKDKLHCK